MDRATIEAKIQKLREEREIFAARMNVNAGAIAAYEEMLTALNPPAEKPEQAEAA